MADEVSFVQEIDESLRAERLEQFWLRSSKTIVMAFGVILVLTIMGVVWKNHNNEAFMRQTHTLVQAKTLSDAGNNAQALATLEAARFSSPNLIALAAIRRAIALTALGNTEKARAAYAEAVTIAGADGTLRDEAALASALLAQNAHTAPDFTHADSPGRPYSAAAREARAAFMLAEGRKDEARPLLQSLLAEQTIPLSERSRVEELLNAAGGAK